MRPLNRNAALIAAIACVGFVLAGQQPHNSSQEGVQQQSYQNMTLAQRADATRRFLGLGAVPDKVAAGRGEPLFRQNCAFCHGRQARGATAPSLITSEQVLADDHGEHLAKFLRKGEPDKGMPAFSNLPARKLTDIAEFLHLQVESVANRGAYQMLNILVGDPSRGKEYVSSHCMSCHSEDMFAHIAGKFHSPDQLQRNWIWPAGKPVTATAQTPQGPIDGRVAHMDDFHLTLVDAAGKSTTLDRETSSNIQIHDPLAPHQEFILTLSNEDMHNVTAYLETLR